VTEITNYNKTKQPVWLLLTMLFVF